LNSTTAIGYRDRSSGVANRGNQGFQVLWPQVLLPQVLFPQVLLPHVLWPMTPQMLLPNTARTLTTRPKFERIMYRILFPSQLVNRSFLSRPLVSFRLSSGRTVSHYGNLRTKRAGNSVEHLKLFNRRQLFLRVAHRIQLLSVVAA
jgi:hypothetical protein